jgi:hypothetical protein
VARISFFTGIGLIALSGLLFTFERFFAVYLYVSESSAVKIRGSGSYGPLSMPSIFDNFYVGFLLVLGLVLLVLGIFKGITNKDNS